MDEVTTRTTLLVVGAEGFPTSERRAGANGAERDERSHKLRKAELINASSPGRIRIVTEEEFCLLAGLASPSTLKQQFYAERDILAMYPSLRDDHLRYLQKWKLLRPVVRTNAERYYSFQDLSLVRQAASELERGVPFRAVLRSLDASRQGQLTLDFRLDARPARVLPLTPRPAEHEPGGSLPALSAEQYFSFASELDDGDPVRQDAAAEGYRRALQLNPSLVPALVNLGNIHYGRDELAEAQVLYERAAAIEPEQFEAHFNLGNVHHDLGRLHEAEACYRWALALNAAYADGHFYLAVTLEKLGRSQEAKPHWRAYAELAPDGEWVELAREFSD